mmetsp:Transcript_14120/g.28145  ORF Transcript_14120/g.28145 Transcript_14120/m.28145 type:complete len:252 (-) Transcript_14120:381-1136(-)
MATPLLLVVTVLSSPRKSKSDFEYPTPDFLFLPSLVSSLVGCRCWVLASLLVSPSSSVSSSKSESKSSELPRPVRSLQLRTRLMRLRGSSYFGLGKILSSEVIGSFCWFSAPKFSPGHVAASCSTVNSPSLGTIGKCCCFFPSICASINWRACCCRNCSFRRSSCFSKICTWSLFNLCCCFCSWSTDAIALSPAPPSSAFDGSTPSLLVSVNVPLPSTTSMGATATDGVAAASSSGGTGGSNLVLRVESRS